MTIQLQRCGCNVAHLLCLWTAALSLLGSRKQSWNVAIGVMIGLDWIGCGLELGSPRQ